MVRVLDRLFGYVIESTPEVMRLEKPHPDVEWEIPVKHLPGLPGGAHMNHIEIEFIPQGHEDIEVLHFNAAPLLYIP